MECLFNPSGLTGNIMSLTTVSAGGVFLGFNTTSNLTVYNSGGSFSLNIAATSGTWYHSIVSINSSGAYSFYLDGLLIKSGTGFTLPSGLVTSYGLGTPAGTAFQGFQGSIGMARMYNFTLTPAQVLQNYFAVVNRVAPTNPYGLPSNFANTYVTNNLIGYWDFGKSASYAGANVLVVNDLSGNGLNMTYALTGSYYPPPYTSNGYGVSVQVGGPGGAAATQNAYIANVAYNQTFSSTGFTFEMALTPTTIYTSGNGNFGLTITNGNSSAPQYWTHLAYANGWFIDTVNNTTETKAPSTYITNPVPIANQMMHAVATVSSSGAYNIYINGTLIGSGTGYVFPTSGAIPYALTLGSFATGTPYGQCALVNAARAYNAPLSAANVWTNYGSVYQGLTYTPSSPGYVVNNLVGYWDFADSRSSSLSGSALNDLGPVGINLSISGTPSYNSSGALSFNPSSTSYAASSAVALNLSSGFTYECLVYFTSLSNTPITMGYAPSSGTSYLLQSINTNGSFLSYGAGSYNGSFNTAAGVVTTGQWYHLVSVFSSTTYTSCVNYVNGVAVANAGGANFTAFPNNPASTQIYLGDVPFISGQYTNGKFAMGRLYSTALSASQVRQNYSAAFSKLYGNPYVLPPPLNQSLAFPPVFNFSASAAVPYYNSVSAASYGNGQYIVTGSSDSSGYSGQLPPGAFSSGAAWSCAGGIFSGSSPFGYLGSSSISTTNAGTLTGIWMTVTLPVSIIPTGFSIISQFATPYYPNVFYIAGTSNFGATWTQLGSYGPTSSPPAVGSMGNYVINSSTPYNQFAFIVNSTCGTPQGQMIIGKLQYYGTPVSSLAVPPGLPYYTSNAQYTTTSLVGYWDAALTASSSGTGSKTLYDLSGNGNNMIFTSAPTYFQTPPCYTVGTANAWATSANMTQTSIELLVNLNGFTGTNSKVFNFGVNGTSNVSFQVTSSGSAVTAASITAYGTTSSAYYLTATLTTPSLIPATGWVHLTFIISQSTYAGPIAIYVNGQVVTTSTSGPSSNPTLGTFTLGTEWELGHNSPIDTGISGAQIGMCRVYSNALVTANQIMTNYIHTINKLPTNVYSLPYTPTVTTFLFYTVTAFLNTGIFTLASTTTCDILVIGGGAGGSIGGGGGAGGYQFFTGQTLSAGNYQVIVGSGGYSGSNSAGGNMANQSGSGGSSQFGSLAPSLGGGGFNNITGTYILGASGSGGGGTYNGGTGGTGGGNAGTAGQGYAGGSNGPGGASGGHGGGGGGGAAGYNPVGNTGGNGGPGVINNGFGTAYGQNVSGSYYFAGGGGGGGGTPGTGGYGGGGNAAFGYGVYAIAGTPNTGGGGGGMLGQTYPANPNAAIGGSGIVLIRYLINTGTPIFPATSLNGGTGSGTVGSPYTITINSVTYTVTASSQYGGGICYPWYAFDKSPTTGNNNDWLALSTNTISTTGTTSTTTTVVSGTTICGEWVQLAFTAPTKTMTQYGLLAAASGSTASSWVIAGSNDGSTWTLIDQRGQTTNSSGVVTSGTAVTLSTTALTTFTVSTTAFAYFRLIIRAGSVATTGFTGMSEFIIYAN